MKYAPLILSNEAKKLKEDFKVNAIISKVSFTTVPHHRTGEIDFIGLKENREIVVIEVKNKQQKINERDRLQLEYYIDGLPKQYHYIKFYSHLYEIATQLYPEKYQSLLKLARSMDLLREEIENSIRIVENTIMGLEEAEKKKFISMYYKPEEGLEETYKSIWSSEENDLDLIRIRKASETFLATIPEYVSLKNTFDTYNKKRTLLAKELETAIDLIVELMERGVRNGLLVDIRRSEIIEVSRTINFDELVRGVWRIKKSVFDDKKVAPKRTEACSRCNFRNTCQKLLRDEEPEESKSVTSVVHKGFKNLNLEVNKPNFITLFDKNGVLRVIYRPRVKIALSDEELLKQALRGTEWIYVPDFVRKRGWKELYSDAVISNKLEKEFDFLRL